MNMGTRYMGIVDQEDSGSKRSNATADKPDVRAVRIRAIAAARTVAKADHTIVFVGNHLGVAMVILHTQDVVVRSD